MEVKFDFELVIRSIKVNSYAVIRKTKNQDMFYVEFFRSNRIRHPSGGWIADLNLILTERFKVIDAQDAKR